MRKVSILILFFVSQAAHSNEQNPIPEKMASIHQSLAVALSEPLALVGTYIPSYSQSQSIPVCLYRNSKVLVKSTYCVSRNVPAAEVTIHWLDGSRSQFSFYAEGPEENDISQQSREKYFPDFWNLSSKDDKVDLNNINIKDYEKYDEASVSSANYGCVTSGALKSSPSYSVCDSTDAARLKSWVKQAYPFWKSPETNWYHLLKRLKTLTP
jgi:hypothetical protein